MMETGIQTKWIKSSHSGGSGSDCVEAAILNSSKPLTGVRDSKVSSGDQLEFDSTTWNSFLRSLNTRQTTRV
ncbi:DUF397 domain-containing protein [Embleya sp. NPDC005575]|uniref:DUF397 domain-containing protein n=1 Tax=Embleya sp. NPDC005575 TaxID=3156892 RepID=UPI0033A7931D